MNKHLHPDHSCEVCKPLRPVNSPLFSGPMLGRRTFFKAASAGVTGFYLTPFLQSAAKAQVAPKLKSSAKFCIFILMAGAPSHTDMFDLKVGDWTPADFNPTSYNGYLFPQGLMPTIAEHLNKLAVIRSVRSSALVHSLQQTWVQIARSPSSALGKIAPNIGSVVALEMEQYRQPNQKLPGFLSLNTGGGLIGSGYFNAKYSPFDITASPNGLSNLTNSDGQTTFNTRFAMLQALDSGLRTDSPLGASVVDMDAFYQQSKGMMYNTDLDAVFKFTTADQTRYGSSGFGNSCVVARNLVKANMGTRFIQINIGGWDNHTNIYPTSRTGGIYTPAGQFDKGLGNLLKDLSEMPGSQGGTLLDETLIVAMGEFGRTVGPLTVNAGRDHYFNQFAVFAGGGVAGSTVIGSTNATGGSVQEPGWSQNRYVANEDIAATIYSAMGIDYTKIRNDDPFKRGFEYVPFAADGVWAPVMEVFKPNRDSRGGGRDGGGRRGGGTRSRS
ncbi:MAG: DUF1501 domain-containing protein [Acidobacteria bacterium]|nr:DUF1501 domain-containing protein [Acidobacteriota bacterium]